MAGKNGITTAYNHLKFLKIFGISLKKFESSFSFAVVPHDMLIWNMWLRIARLKWNESPPKNMANIGIHLKFSRRDANNGFSPRRYRIMARQTFPAAEKTTSRLRKTIDRSQYCVELLRDDFTVPFHDSM